MRVQSSFFWAVRNPLYYVIFFILGWLAACYRSPLASVLHRHRITIVALCLLGIGAWGMRQIGTLPPPWFLPLRVPYTVGVAGLIIVWTYTRPAHLAIRFLSETSLATYLFHHIFQLAVQPYTATWHPFVRILTLVIFGLTGSAIVCAAGRLVLGRHARTFLGA